MIVFRVIAVILLAALAVLGLYQCTPAFRIEDSTRYRFTIEVDDHGKLKRDSKVIEKREWVDRIGADKHKVRSALYGEAPLVKLDDGKVVVALLRCFTHPLPDEPTILPDEGCIAEGAVYSDFGVTPGWVGADPKGPRELRKAATGKQVILRPEDMPAFVTFRDTLDPRTIELVDPGNLAARLGPGVAMRRATIEITQDEVEKSIKETLPWLSRWRSQPVQVAYISSEGVRLTGNLHASAFTPNQPWWNPTPY